MQFSFRRLLIGVGLLWLPVSSAYAKGTFTIEGADLPSGTAGRVLKELYGAGYSNATIENSLDGTLSTSLNSLKTQLQSQVNTELAKHSATPFLRSMSNAGAGAGRMLTVDYASQAELFTLSVGVGAVASSYSLLGPGSSSSGSYKAA